MNKIFYVITCAISFFLSYAGTPITRKVALRYQILDIPNGKLKQQLDPVPYMGGVIVYFAMISAVSLFTPFNQEILGILLSSSILLIIGLFDDMKAMTPGIKFLFQLVATYLLLKSGIWIRLVFIPLPVNIALSSLFILTMINAYNLLDIMDGLSSSVGLLSCLTLFIISLLDGNSMIAFLSLALAGALLGFIRFNWEPAQIYLGDAGSMVLGLIIGSLTILGSYTRYNPLGFLSAFLIIAWPLFDLVYVVLLRLTHKRSPFQGSPDHFALRLRKKFRLSARHTVWIIIFVQILLSISVITNYFFSPEFTIAISSFWLLFFLVIGWIFSRVRME